jgi:hypothetical protein
LPNNNINNHDFANAKRTENVDFIENSGYFQTELKAIIEFYESLEFKICRIFLLSRQTKS